MEITSPAFEQNQPIPAIHSRKGGDISPPLQLSNVPAGTKSLALIVDDPDAPGKTFVHWLIWNIPPDTKELPEGINKKSSISLGVEGINHYENLGYAGPCPPHGNRHRYYFKLYALNTTLSLPPGSSKLHLEEAMKDHILQKAELMGTFQQ